MLTLFSILFDWWLSVSNDYNDFTDKFFLPLIDTHYGISLISLNKENYILS